MLLGWLLRDRESVALDAVEQAAGGCLSDAEGLGACRQKFDAMNDLAIRPLVMGNAAIFWGAFPPPVARAAVRFDVVALMRFSR